MIAAPKQPRNLIAIQTSELHILYWDKNMKVLKTKLDEHVVHKICINNEIEVGLVWSA